jgi:hypothetical protein
MVKFDEGWGMDLIGIFPSIVAFGVSFPFDKVLQGFLVTPPLMSTDLFHLIFLFSINQIRGRLHEIWSMGWRFSVGC